MDKIKEITINGQDVKDYEIAFDVDGDTPHKEYSNTDTDKQARYLFGIFNIFAAGYGYDVGSTTSELTKKEIDNLKLCSNTLAVFGGGDFMETLYKKYGQGLWNFDVSDLEQEEIDRLIAIVNEHLKPAQNIPSVLSATSKEIENPTAKAMNIFFDGTIEESRETLKKAGAITQQKGYTANIDVFKDKKASVSLTIYDILPENKLNAYDKAIYKSICTLWDKNKENTITGDQILNLLSGNQGKKITNTQRESVDNTIKKLSTTLVEYDATEQVKRIARERHAVFDEFKSFTYRGNMLHVDTLTAKTKQGNYSTAYKILKPPVFLEYSREIKQIGRISADLYAIDDISNTERNIALKDIIFETIEMIKNPNNSFESDCLYLTGERGIYKQLQSIDNEEFNATQKKRIREDIEKILNHCKKKNYIKKYTFIKAGSKEIAAVKIEL